MPKPDANGVGEVIARGPNVMLGYFERSGSDPRARWLIAGSTPATWDVLDDDGNLYLVGRSKEIIVDTNGKNVYPDELEELYSNSPYIKELSIVGLPDGIGEKVACLVVPDDEYDIALSRRRFAARIEEHFREVSASLPYYKRVKVLQFTDIELPRTATRKVKRQRSGGDHAEARAEAEGRESAGRRAIPAQRIHLGADSGRLGLQPSA